MYADSLLGILNSKEAAGYLRIIALLISAVALMSSCATSTQFSESSNRRRHMPQWDVRISSARGSPAWTKFATGHGLHA